MFSKQYQGIELSANDLSSQYTYVLLLTFTTVQSILTFLIDRKRHNKLFYISLSLIIGICFFILSSGFRTFSMNIFILLLVLYNDRIKRIKIVPALITIFLGIFVLSTIGHIRNEGVTGETLSEFMNEKDDSENSFEFANDLIINNRSLYFLVEYVHRNSYTYGLTWLGGILGAIPFASGLFQTISGVNPDFLGSATFNTFLTLGSIRHVGLGTNVVADAYIPFGIIGAILVFFFFGKFVYYIQNKASSNIYYCIAYYALVSRAIFTARSGIFMNLQIIVWSIFIVWLLIKFIEKK